MEQIPYYKALFAVYKLETGNWDIFYRHAELLITWISLPLSLIGLVNLQIQNTNTNDAFTGVLVA